MRQTLERLLQTRAVQAINIDSTGRQFVRPQGKAP